MHKKYENNYKNVWTRKKRKNEKNLCARNKEINKRMHMK